LPIAQRTATSGTVASSAGFSITLPAGTAVGDIVVVVVGNAWITSGPAAPSGWTRRYAASAGTGQFCCVYTAPYSAGLTLAFTNVGAIASWACNSYWQASTSIAYSSHLAATNTANNTSVSTGQPVTTRAGSFEVLLYCWGSSGTITAGSGSTMEKTQANSTTISVSIGRNNTNPIGAAVTCTAFAPTLSATNRAKTGVGLVLEPVPVYKDLTGSAAGRAICGPTSWPGYQPTILATSGLQAYLRLNDVGGVALDTSGKGKDGTYNGTYSLAQAGSLTGDADNSVLFSSGYVQAPLLAAFDNSAFTVEMWIKAPGGGWGNGQLFCVGDSHDPEELVHCTLESNGAGLKLGFWFDDHNVNFTVLSTSVWHHVVFAFEGPGTKYQRIYLNGLQQGSGRVATAAPSITTGSVSGNGVQIARVDGASVPGMYIDEVAIYDVALSAAQVYAHYAEGVRVGSPPTVIGKSPVRLLPSVSSSGVATATASVLRKRALVGTSSGVAAEIGQPTAKRLVAFPSASSGVASVTAAPARIRVVVATASGISTVTAAPSRKRPLGASSAGVAAVTAIPVRKRVMVATASGLATVGATTTRKRAVVGTSSGLTVVSGLTTRKRAIAGTVNGLSTSTAQIRIVRLLGGTSSGITVSSGIISLARLETRYYMCERSGDGLDTFSAFRPSIATIVEQRGCRWASSYQDVLQIIAISNLRSNGAIDATLHSDLAAMPDPASPTGFIRWRYTFAEAEAAVRDVDPAIANGMQDVQVPVL